MPVEIAVGPPLLSINHGATFMVTGLGGEIEADSEQGVFADDTRFVSYYAIFANGVPWQRLNSAATSYYAARVYLTNAAVATEAGNVPAGTLSLVISRAIGDGIHEDLDLANHGLLPVRFNLEIALRADFADLFEVKGKEFRKGGRMTTAHDPGRSLLVFECEHEAFRVATRVHPSVDARVEGDDLLWRVRVDPLSEWHAGVEVLVHLEDEVKEPTHDTFGEPERQATRVLQKWQAEVPEVTSGFDVVWHTMERSVIDLASLRLQACVEGNEYSLPAAGLPWFMAIFGRDTLITSYQSMWVGPELAKGALAALAGFQGSEVNDVKDEEPGKILHEIRYGELTALGEKPYRPYYGSLDATPLWLILLHEYWWWTGDEGPVRSLESNARRALEWIERFGDLDSDGYLEFRTRSPQGLRTQSWKDSWNGLLFADGSLPEVPIAPAEVQGYAYDARLRTAELAERVWRDADLATRLRSDAEALAARFNEDFWIDRRGGYYAVGLDRDKRPIDSMTSNMGHLLWSGIVPRDRASVVARQLFTEAMWSGWGVRTLSWDDLGYNPIGYHIGTVWPHDNSLIAAGLARYGLREEANRIASAMLAASGYTESRLPEVFAGYSKDEAPFPVRYPTASSPQAWATGAPFLWFRLALGLEPRDGEMVIDPLVPRDLGRVGLTGVHGAGSRWELWAEGNEGQISRIS